MNIEEIKVNKGIILVEPDTSVKETTPTVNGAKFFEVGNLETLVQMGKQINTSLVKTVFYRKDDADILKLGGKTYAFIKEKDVLGSI